MKKNVKRAIATCLAAGIMATSALGTCTVFAEEEVTLRILTRWSGTSPEKLVLDHAIEEFQAKYPDVIIQDESINDSVGWDNKFKTDLASGDIADIIGVTGFGNNVEYAKAGVFMELSEVIEGSEDLSANYDKSMLVDLGGYGVDGIYGMPIFGNMEVFYYNKEAFAKAGIEKEPETWDEFFDACEKLQAAGIIPWAVGAKNPWRVVHIYTGLTYKMHGTDKGENLGSGQAAWNDADMIEVVDFIKDLKAKEIFEADMEGIDYETEKQMVLSGEAAMRFDGTWAIGEFGENADNIGTFRMPYFTDKEEYKTHDIMYTSQLGLSGKLEGKEKEMAIEFLRMFLTKSAQEVALYDVGTFPVRTDIEVDTTKLNPMSAEISGYKLNDITTTGEDIWAYDTLPTIETVLSDALIGALLGMTGEEASQQIVDDMQELRAE